MKTILSMAAAALLCTPTLMAQKSVEPAAAPGAGLATPDSVSSSRSSRRPGPPPVQLGGSANEATAVTTYFGKSSSRGDSIPPVMIRFSAPDPKASAQLEEDLFVMARVLSRTLERADAEKVDYKMNVPMLLTGSGRSVRPMYLDDLGPLFMIKVSFPLIPAPKGEEKTVRKLNEDSEWREAQRDLFDDAEVVYEESSSRDGYKEEQVELLKKELIGALKNAANIRGLRADEFVNIAVFGHASSGRVKSVTMPGTTAFAPAKAYIADASKGSVLTIRARKSDIDAFAAGKLEAEAFKAKVKTTAYAGSGTGITSINSWIQEGGSRSRSGQ